MKSLQGNTHRIRHPVYLDDTQMMGAVKLKTFLAMTLLKGYHIIETLWEIFRFRSHKNQEVRI